MRFVLTGAPGAGKTTLRELAGRGHVVVAEAATDVIAIKQAEGMDEPWRDLRFTEWICALQGERQRAADQQRCRLTIYDRSPICTLALARFLSHPVRSVLAAEVERIARERVYPPAVFLVHPLGRIEASSARRISYQESLRFGALHAAIYQELGYQLLEVLMRHRPYAPIWWSPSCKIASDQSAAQVLTSRN